MGEQRIEAYEKEAYVVHSLNEKQDFEEALIC